MNIMQDQQRERAQAALNNLVSQMRSGSCVPGMSVGLSVAGQRLTACDGVSDISRNWPMPVEARFGVACITKLLVGIVVATMISDGLLDPDLNVAEALSECGAPDFERGIKLQHLLSHSSGYQGPLIYGVGHRKFSWAEFSRELGASKQTFQPGKVFNYENTGHVLVGEILRRITGRDVLDLIREHVFGPLGIEPHSALKGYRDAGHYVAPHRLDGDVAQAVAPSPFGQFWSASLADITLSIQDLLSIGEAVIGLREEVDFSGVVNAMVRRLVEIPKCVSGVRREHTAAFFNSVCAEYGGGWYGYAGSALGQTCGLRFDLRSSTVCAVGMNAWVPVVRDLAMDKLCGTTTHPEAGTACGNTGYLVTDLIGDYVGGGNLIRSLHVRKAGPLEIEIALGEDGLQSPPFHLKMNERTNLLSPTDNLATSVGFFPDPETSAPCIMVGMSALKRVG